MEETAGIRFVNFRGIPNKTNNRHYELNRLRQLLQKVPAGILPEQVAGEAESLIIACWDCLCGSEVECTTANKLSGRIEELRWQPPYVTFQIERHGGTVMGSTRAEVHDWTLNLETAEAGLSTGRFRQLTPRDPPLKVGPLVDRVVQAIGSGSATPDLTWLTTDKLRVNIAQMIPATVQQTTIGRRRRFRKQLEARLAQLNWYAIAGAARNTYHKVT